MTVRRCLITVDLITKIKFSERRGIGEKYENFHDYGDVTVFSLQARRCSGAPMTLYCVITEFFLGFSLHCHCVLAVPRRLCSESALRRRAFLVFPPRVQAMRRRCSVQAYPCYLSY